jgi:hypothetical protein
VLNSEVGFQPRLLTGARALKVARAVSDQSKPMGSRIAEVDGRYMVLKTGD